MLHIRLYHFASILFAAVSCLVFSGLLLAQLPTGTFLGVVKDSSGAVVPGAMVTIQSTETNQTRNVTTDTSGSYRVPALPVGHYDIKVEASGFRTATNTGLNLEVGQEAVVNFALQVGTAQQTVQVTGEVQQINTTNSTLGTVVGEQTISELPLNGRNYTDLTLLQPGIAQHKNMTNSGGNQPGTVFSSNGAPYQSNSYSLDGASMVSTFAVSAASGTGNTLGVDGIREYKVVTNNFSAEYGMTMGSQTVLVSKGGTNAFHGDAFEFLRNSALDAANYFDTPTEANGFQRTPSFRRNNFGGSLGGPIQKNKTFFFAAYEGLREKIGQTVVSGTVPANCFGATNNPCAKTSKNPTGLVNPAAFQILQLFPQPNLPVGCTVAPCQVTFPSDEPISENWGQFRVDRSLSASDSIFGRYTLDDSYLQYGLAYLPFVQTTGTRSQFITLSEDHIFTPTLLNTARMSFSRTAATLNSPSDYGPNYPSLFTGQQYPGLGTFQITGVTTSTEGAGLGPTATKPEYPIQNIWTVSDDVFYERGKSSWKFGTLINHYYQRMYNRAQSRGSIKVNDLPTFLAGTLSSVQVEFYPSDDMAYRHYTFDTYGFYAQNDYKMRSNLTLNLGLRYEFATVASDAKGLNSRSTLTCAYPCSEVGPMYKNYTLGDVSPRVGFAWDVFGNGKMSVRGGGALMYDIATLGETLIGGVGKAPPYGTSATVKNLPFTIPIDSSVFTAPTNGSNVNVGGVAYDMNQPKLYQWNLTVERQLPWTTALQFSYVGSRGIHLEHSGDGNPTLPIIQNGQPFWSATAPRVVNNTWGAFPDPNTGDSIYHALQVSVTKRINHGLQFQSEYTYAKLIDNGDGRAPSQSSATSEMMISEFFPNLDRSLASYDVRNNYRFNTVYNLPASTASNSFVRGALSGWWTAAILSLQNGTPFTPSVSANRSQSRTGSSNPTDLDRPDWAAGRNPYNATHGVSSGCAIGTGSSASVIPAGTPLGTPTLYFDPCAFVLDPLGYEGNVARDSLIGPGLLDVDFSLVKDTAVKWLGEAGKIEFRAELFNILNHPNFAQPNRSVFAGTSTAVCPDVVTGCPAGTENPVPNTGLIQSTATGTTATQASGNSRQIQFGLKVVF